MLHCCRTEMRLDILDGNDLTKIIYSHSVAPHQPGRMCSVSPSKILYEDRSGNPCRVHWLDCSDKTGYNMGHVLRKAQRQTRTHYFTQL